MKKKRILVTGGAGYIGSHTVLQLLKEGYEVVVFDNLDYGHKEAVPDSVKLIIGDLRNYDEINEVFKNYKFDGVIHFAAYALAGESVDNPGKYFRNNVFGTLNLLQIMVDNQVKKLVFSSSCAVYGQPEKLPIDETESKKPESPYGESKLMVEQMLRWFRGSLGLRFVALRYFNAAGAALDASIGEDHHPETHLIPIALQVAAGKRSEITIFGDDYDTPDGSCVRDYIHVLDLADVHLKALEYLLEGGESDAFNVGTGHGYSVKQIIDVVKSVTGVDFKVKLGDRRPGDPAYLYANNEKVNKRLNWSTKYSDIEKIVTTAWNWHRSNPEGYPSSKL